jgi:glucose/arabinose dehydrogenase/PKD repeat protein
VPVISSAISVRTLRASLTALCVSVTLFVVGLPPGARAQTGGFQIQYQFISGLSSPTAMAFTPDGRLFVTQQGGAVRVITAAGQLLPDPLLTVGVRSDEERGLLGIALDPQFASNGWVYLFYTPNDAAVTRVRRFTATANVADPASGFPVFEYDNFSGNHRGGDLHFGPDGLLYIALGDAGESANAQSVASFDGKILRLNKDGSVPAGNPTTFTNSSGTTITPVGEFRTIWAIGLRNPYRFSFHDDTGTMRINDVGAGLREEVNIGVAGANYGWPTCEGMCANAFTRNPIYTHERGPDPDHGCAITGGAFERGNQFPAEYTDRYFLIDYCRTWLRYLRVDDSFALLPFTIPESSVDLKFAPDGSLLILGHGSGTISRVTYVGAGGNRNPVAMGTATPTSGPAPLTVSFSGAASSDPDGDPLSYGWSFGDGGTGGGISTSHTYANSGSFNATLTVSDGRGGSNARSFAISVGMPPTATISLPAQGTLYSAGDTVGFSGTATNSSGAALPASAFSWTVLFHHDTHTHPALGPLNGVQAGSFTIPRTGHPEHTVFYRIYLTVTDASGLQTQVTRDVTPRKAQMTIAANVAGAQILLNGQPQVAPFSFTSVVGVQWSVEAPSPQSVAGQNYAFSQWSDGGARSHVVTAPLTNQTYTATWTPVTTPPDGRPRALASVVARTSVALTWAPPAGSALPVTGYLVEAGLEAGTPLWSLPVGNVLTFSTIAPSGGYFVRVRALTSGGPSAPSEEIVVVTGQAAVPLAPLGLLATVQGSNVAFQWRENPLGPEVTQYQLHAGTGPGLANLAVVPLASAPTAFAAAAPAGTYYVRVMAVNAAGVGPPSNEAAVTLGSGVCTVPAVPTGLTATPQAGAVTVRWDAPASGAVPTGYRLEAGTFLGAANIAVLALPATTTVGGPVPPGPYFARLAATNGCGSSPVSADIAFVVP